jgi:large subunit ribosomal protein L18
MAKLDTRMARKRRHERVRHKVTGEEGRPRFCVFRSAKYIYAQIIDDTAGHTLVAASNLDPEIKAIVEGKDKTESAELIGTVAAKRALDKGISKVVFDRGGYKFHGRVKALAEAARKAGLQF